MMMNLVDDIKKAPESILTRLRSIAHLALDMDGTIYNGKTLFPFTKQFLKNTKASGVGYSFLTNNPTRSVTEYLAKLDKLGIQSSSNEIYTSANATIDYLKYHCSDIKKIFVLGTLGMMKQFEENGFEIATDDPDDIPDAVIVAFDTTLTYDKLCRAAWWVSEGLPYYATNPDWVCPTDEATILVDCGSLCQAIQGATGRKPDKVLGKPNAEMLKGILETRKLAANQVAMVGDRIYTDMKMAKNAGAFGILVLSGEATLEDAEQAETELDLVVPHIGVLGDLLEYAKRKTTHSNIKNEK